MAADSVEGIIEEGARSISHSRAAIRQHAQTEEGRQLLAKLPQGHGSGLHADLLDGLHAQQIIDRSVEQAVRRSIEYADQQARGHGGGFTGDHGDLGGLTDDDHSQYALLAGRAGDHLYIDRVYFDAASHDVYIYRALIYAISTAAIAFYGDVYLDIYPLVWTSVALLETGGGVLELYDGELLSYADFKCQNLTATGTLSITALSTATITGISMNSIIRGRQHTRGSWLFQAWDGAAYQTLASATGSFWGLGFGIALCKDIIMAADDTYDIGAAGAEVKDLYVDGHAYIDDLRIDVGLDVDGIDQAGAVGGSQTHKIPVTANATTMYIPLHTA